MQPTIKVDYSPFSVMTRQLQSYSPLSFSSILKRETASVIKIAALNAKVANAAAIKARVIDYGSQDYTSPDGTRVIVNHKQYAGRVWMAFGSHTETGRIRGIGALMMYQSGPTRGWHVSDFRWQAYLLAVSDRAALLKVRIREALARRGLQRLSWLQIADQLGVPLSSVSPAGSLQESIVRSARGPRGRVFANGSARFQLSASALVITVRNDSPLAIKNQGQRGLDRAVAQRLKGFEIAMAKGVLNDLQLRAARWKGIFVGQ